jgi:hypothetical protein
MNYKRAKKKYFRTRVKTWTLYEGVKKILAYNEGLFIPHVRESLVVLSIMYMSDNNAFWAAYELAVTSENYSMRFSGYNNSITFTTTKHERRDN